MAEHIDRTYLNTNLRYHFDYLSKFLNFSTDDINTLNSFAPILFPHIPLIVETVYKKLYSFDITKQFFILRNQNFESFSSNDKNDSTVLSAQTNFRKDMLSIYLQSILIQSEWNDTFLQYLSQIGELHGNKKKFKTINVDYIHINTLFGYLEHLIIDTIWNVENIGLKEKYAGIRAINKIFWIQNNFFTMHYERSLKENSISNEVNEKKSTCPLK